MFICKREKYTWGYPKVLGFWKMPCGPLCTAGHWPFSDPFAPLSVIDADPQCTDAIVPTKKGDLRTKKQIQTSLIHFQFFVCRKLFS